MLGGCSGLYNTEVPNGFKPRMSVAQLVWGKSVNGGQKGNSEA